MVFVKAVIVVIVDVPIVYHKCYFFGGGDGGREKKKKKMNQKHNVNVPKCSPDSGLALGPVITLSDCFPSASTPARCIIAIAWPASGSE